MLESLPPALPTTDKVTDQEAMRPTTTLSRSWSWSWFFEVLKSVLHYLSSSSVPTINTLTASGINWPSRIGNYAASFGNALQLFQSSTKDRHVRLSDLQDLDPRRNTFDHRTLDQLCDRGRGPHRQDAEALDQARRGHDLRP